MPVVCRRRGDGGSQQSFLCWGIKACAKPSASILDQKPCSGWQWEMDRTSLGSLPGVQQARWSMDRTSPFRGRWDHALALVGPAWCWHCCSVTGWPRIASWAAASPDTPVRVYHPHTMFLRQFLLLDFWIDVSGWAAHGSGFGPEMLQDANSFQARSHLHTCTSVPSTRC